MDIIPVVRAVSWGELPKMADVLARADVGAMLETNHHQFGRELTRRFPELVHLGAHILHQLNGPAGICLVDQLDALAVEPSLIAAAFVALCHQVGVPTGHNDQNQVVWHVKDRPVDGNRERTFSERTGEAPFHTDSAFARRPEDYFALYSVRPADCGGGQSRLIPADRLAQLLSGSAEGRWCKSVLETNNFPFKTPAAFSQDRRTTYGKIFADGRLRYRYDALIQGMEAAPQAVTEEMREALEWFNDFVENRVTPIEFTLAAGQAIFVNNYRVLHARSPYVDPHRHLIRIRMERREGVEVSDEDEKLRRLAV